MRFGSVPYFDVPVSRVVLGSIGLLPDSPELAFEIMDRYIERGGNAIDTAHIYGEARHKMIGDYLRSRGRDSFIVMDKGCHPYGRKRVTREDMRDDINDSLTRMGIDRLDFFVLHRDDPDVPAGEVIEWLNELKGEGKITAFGGSNWAVSRIEEGNDHAKKQKLQGFSLSNPNLALALPQAEMWPGVSWVTRSDRDWFERTSFPLFAWSSAANGFFAGVESDDVKRVYHNEDNFGRRERAAELGRKYNLSPTQIAISWALNQPLNCFALIGPRKVEEVDQNMATAMVQLTPEELDYLESGHALTADPS